MKKKLIIAAFMLAICLNFVGCNNYEKTTNLIAVPDTEDLYYDPQSKIVYFIFSEDCGYQGYGYMSAYYAPNGLPYLYNLSSQELVEIGKT